METGILEYKSMDRLNSIESESKEYRGWQEELKNALTQIRPRLRKAIDEIEKEEWGKGERTEWQAKEGEVRERLNMTTDEWYKLKSDMYTVLVAKTIGDARLFIRNEELDGLMGYMRLHKWFMESSGRGMQERIRGVHRPEQAKTEDEMFKMVENGKKK